MKIDPTLLESLSQLAAIKLNKVEKETLLESLNGLIEDFSCLNDFQVEEQQQNTFSISLRVDEVIPCTDMETLHQNFPHKADNLLIAPLIVHDEK
jgi:aspartyl/glutamyl-tRNA(Asn/Gln) amidotransferase C subunit